MNTSMPEDIEKFYEDLSALITGVPTHTFLAVLSDARLNARPKDAPFTFHIETNRNGKCLTELMIEHGLYAASTGFQKKQGKRWLHQDRCTKVRRQLDYILVRRKWKNSVLDAEPYNSFHTTGSDHCVVSIKLQLNLRVPKPNHCER